MYLFDKRKFVNVPFSPKSFPFFYGWVMVFAGTVGILAGIPGQTIGVGVFSEYLIEATALSRTQLSTAYMVGTLCSGFSLPLAGTIIDRIGTRTAIVAASLLMGISLTFMAVPDKLITFIMADSAIAAFAVLAFGFFLIRFFGQGCLTMVSRVAMTKWFNHRRGFAMAVSGVFVAFGFNSSPKLLNELVNLMGWRNVYLLLAVVIGLGMSAVGFIFFRDNPEQCGMIMDGIKDPHWQKKMADRIPEVLKQFTRTEAMKTYVFWVFTISMALQGLIMTAVTFHITSIGQENALTRDQAYSVFVPIAFAAVAGNFFGGWIADKIRLKWLLMALLACQSLGLLGLLNMDHQSFRYLLIIGYGFSSGLFPALMSVTWPRFFGRDHLGAISGATTSLIVLACAVGPVLFSMGRKITHSYHAVILFFFFVPILLLFLAVRADNPQEKYFLHIQ